MGQKDKLLGFEMIDNPHVWAHLPFDGETVAFDLDFWQRNFEVDKETFFASTRPYASR